MPKIPAKPAPGSNRRLVELREDGFVYWQKQRIEKDAKIPGYEKVGDMRGSVLTCSLLFQTPSSDGGRCCNSHKCKTSFHALVSLNAENDFLTFFGKQSRRLRHYK